MTTDSMQITGTVKRAFATKTGRAIALTVKNPRRDYPDEVTAWADLDVAAGDRITVRGDYSDRIDVYQSPSGAKQIIRRNLNNVILVERHDIEPAAPVAEDGSWTPGEAPPEDPWATPPAPAVDDETPF